MRSNWTLIFMTLVALVLTLTSCSEQPYYEKVYSFDNNEWKQDQKAVFNVDIDDTTATYRFVLTLRTTTDYANSNIWLFWNSQTPNNEKVKEPFEILITNPDGSWAGKSSGTIVENQLTFADRKIAVPGNYKFTIEQAVTAEKVDEVLDLGLSVFKNKK
jgi:gliding motility-associated lipoprotein GldH